MQLSDLRKELSERVRAYDDTVPADQTVLNRWLNLAQTEMFAKWEWSFSKALYILQTVTDITTGTVTATNASTAITFSSAPTPSVANRFIQFSNANDWYSITAHTAAAAAATLGQNFLGTTSSTLTYTVRQFFYSLPSDFDKAIIVSQAITPRQLVPLSYVQFEKNLVFTSATGTPEAYYLPKLDSSNNLQIGFYPIPSATINVWIDYHKRTTDMSADGDKGNIPEKYHPVMLDLATAYAFNSLDDSKSVFWFTKAYGGISEMKITDRMDSGSYRIMTPIDERYPKGQIVFRLPAAYGPEGL